MILLSFDIEEFDLPKEHNAKISLADGVKFSDVGANRILDILKKTGVKATFFCTGNFAQLAPKTIKRMVREGHEVACHGVDHWQSHASDPVKSKQIVEKISGRKAYGYRQPRMFPIDKAKLAKTGYLYDSSLNPAFIPGRYAHFSDPRTPFMDHGVLQIPASVTPKLRIPLFWLSLHHFPEKLYYRFAKKVIKRDHLFVTYFHPWEFRNLKKYPKYHIPWLISHNSGAKMAQRLTNLIKMFQKQGYKFGTYSEYAKQHLSGPLVHRNTSRHTHVNRTRRA